MLLVLMVTDAEDPNTMMVNGSERNVIPAMKLFFTGFVLKWGFLQILMLNDRIGTLSKLGAALTKTEEYLSKLADSTPYSSFEHKYI